MHSPRAHETDTRHDEPLLWRVFDASARARAASVAVEHGTTHVTYEALHRRALLCRERLGSAGVESGELVALLAFDPATTLAWMFGALSIGATVMPMFPSGPESNAGLQHLPPSTVVACRYAADGVVSHDANTKSPLPPGMVVSTAGTTGTPKAVVHTHETLGAGVRALQLLRPEASGEPARPARGPEELLRDLHATAAQEPLGLVYGSTMPLPTTAGLTVALQALLGGERLVMTGSDPRGVLEAFDRSRITNISLSPALARLVARAARRARRIGDPSPLLAGIGGGPVPPALPLEIERVLGCPTAVGYGMTELGGPVTMGRVFDTADVRHATVGRPIPGVNLRVDGETSELLVESASQCVGYLAPTRDMTSVGVDGWFATGDRAVIRGDGAVVLDGRIDALIVRGGRNIDPAMIEQTLESHPAVARAAAMAVPSPVAAGEHDIWSFVVLDMPAPEQALRAHCYDRLGAPFTPQRIVPVDSLPCAADGGIRRHELQTYVPRGAGSSRRRPRR